MRRTRRFVFTFTVSDEFLSQSPWADRYVAACQSQIAKKTAAVGPRGGVYRLDPAEPLVWQQSSNGYYDFMQNLVRFATKRTGRYVPPSRVTPDLRLAPDYLIKALELPVVEGVVVLPDGGKVETTARVVTVPVLA